MSDNMNNQRALWANAALSAFANEVLLSPGAEEDDVLMADLMVNFRHLADAQGWNIQSMWDGSLEVYNDEVQEQGAKADADFSEQPWGGTSKAISKIAERNAIKHETPQIPKTYTPLDSAFHECQNCGMAHDIEDLVLPIPNYDQRVSEGEPEPSGECPSCGALCQPWDGKPTHNLTVVESDSEHNEFFIHENRTRAELDEKNFETINASLKFVRTLARFTTPEDEVANPDSLYHNLPIDEFLTEMSDERLGGEYHTFMAMVRDARKILNGEPAQ